MIAFFMVYFFIFDESGALLPLPYDGPVPAPSLLPGVSGLPFMVVSAILLSVSGLTVDAESLALVARLLWQAAIVPQIAMVMSNFFMGRVFIIATNEKG